MNSFLDRFAQYPSALDTRHMICSSCHHANRPQAQFCAKCGAPLHLQNKYRIVRLLGRGGYSAVYEAEHLGLGGARFAIKELLPETNATPAQRQIASNQFRFEASILAKLNHPMLPKVTDFFTERGRDYLVMEFVPGQTLEQLLAQANAPLPEAQILEWANELCGALNYLHAQQPPVIHRDVKPSNIKITPDNKIKLLDFGISKLMSGSGGTGTAARAVTAPYSPLEQYGRGTDARSDIYALGVTLYQLLTNHLPPAAPDRTTEAVISPRYWNPLLSTNTEAVVLKAISIQPADRFQSVLSFQSALRSGSVVQQASGFASVASSAGTPTISSQPLRVFPWVAILGLLGLAVLFIVAFVGVREIVNSSQATATAAAQATAVALAQSTATQRAETTETAEHNATQIANSAATATAQTQATQTAISIATAQQEAAELAAQRATDNARQVATAVAQTANAQIAQWQASRTAEAQATLHAQAVATAAAESLQATATARHAATATLRARRPFGSNFTFGRDHIEIGDCYVAVPTTTVKRSALAADEWLYFASPFTKVQEGTNLYWTVYQPDGSEIYGETERELSPDKNLCFWQGFSITQDNPTGDYRLEVKYNEVVIYRITFTVTD